jgi:hypothetical protein
MTYEELAQRINQMDEHQKECDVTVELKYSDEWLRANLDICGENHDMLDEDHPVLIIDF